MSGKTRKILGFIFCAMVAAVFLSIALTNGDESIRTSAIYMIIFCVLAVVGIVFARPLES
jgi:hypothetical protein